MDLETIQSLSSEELLQNKGLIIQSAKILKEFFRSFNEEKRYP